MLLGALFLKNPFWIKSVVFVAAPIPLGLLAFDGYSGDLGANPIEVTTRSTGTWTLVFLLVTLAITPLRRFSGWNSVIKLRRMLGLFAFFYACLHFTTYLWLDQFFDLAEITKDIYKRPFITVGFFSFILLIPMAATSTTRMIQRLGKRWQQLHRWVYISAIGGVIHYLWLVKADARKPLIYACIVTVLLASRFIVAWKQRPLPVSPPWLGRPKLRPGNGT